MNEAKNDLVFFIQKAEECHTAVPVGSMLLLLPALLALRHLFLLVATSSQGTGTAQEESNQENGETQSQEASRFVTQKFSTKITYTLLWFSALLAMKGMMLQDNATLDEALKKMEEGQMANSKGPALPPRVIGE